MSSDFSGVSSQPGIKGLSTPQAYSPTQTKNLQQPGAGGAANPELAGWYEQAYAYYNAVMSGAEARPDPAAWQSFMDQMQWAAGQLGYGGPQAGGWNPGMGGPGGPMGQQGPQSNQFGGMSGTMDNWVYTDEKASIGFTGDGTHDIWSNDTTINVAPTSAKVTVENTNDTRTQPPESVVKITVTDPATGTQAVYFVHNYDPTKDKIKINTPDSASQVVNNTGDPNITTGKFTSGGASGGTKPDASIEGQVQDDGSIVYEPEFAGGTIDFWANPGENQTSIVYSDANISVKPSDTVNISNDTGGVIVVKVTHRDGSTDTYKVQKGYKVNVNQNAEYVTYGTPPVSSEEVPSDLSERVTLNGGVSTEGTTGASPDAIVSGLLEATGRNEAQLISALKASGYNYNTIADLKKAIKDKEFPPAKPDAKLVDFLRRLDANLASDCNDLTALIGTDSSKDSQKKTLTQSIQDRLVELLGKLYPPESGAIINSRQIAPTNFGGAIQFNGEDFDWALKTTGELDGSMA
ncbi:MAG: hypothetical protein U1F66_13365 [bacterium]